MVLHPDTMQHQASEAGVARWRRRRDSNPRDAFDAYTISSRADKRAEEMT